MSPNKSMQAKLRMRGCWGRPTEAPVNAPTQFHLPDNMAPGVRSAGDMLTSLKHADRRENE